MSDPTTGAQIEKPAPNSFLCMLDYFRNILVHLPLKGIYSIFELIFTLHYVIYFLKLF